MALCKNNHCSNRITQGTSHAHCSRGWQNFLLGSIFLICVFLIAAVFFIGQLQRASQKPFWGDEDYGIKNSARGGTYIQLILHGARGQGSPSPLDYLAIKFLDQIKERVFYLGLTPESYFRLFANFITTISIVVIIFLFLEKIFQEKLGVMFVQMILFLLASAAFLFKGMVYYYAAEMRPYASWNSLWLMVLAASLLKGKGNSRILFILLILLALSATASIFQIGSIALAYGVVCFLEKENMRCILKNVLRLFGLPLGIAFYYCLRAGTWSMTAIGGSWDDFLSFWVHRSTIVPLMSLAILLCLVKKENRKYAIAPLSALILYLIGPIMFFMIRLKGFFYVDRHFIFYDITNTVFLFTVVCCLPVYLNSLKGKFSKIFVSICILFIGMNLALRPKIQKKICATIQNAGIFLDNTSSYE